MTNRQNQSLSTWPTQTFVQKLNNGVSIKLLAEKYGIGTFVVFDIKKNMMTIIEYVSFFFQ